MSCRVGKVKRAHLTARSIELRDRSELRRRPVGQVEHQFVDVAPGPALGRIVPLDDRMSGGVEMLGRMAVGRAVAAADVAAGAAEPQVEPGRSRLEALLASARA